MIGYWLLPAEPARSWLVSTIEELARKYDAPVFEPHVTLYSDEADERAARNLLERVAALHHPFEPPIEGVEHSEKFTKTLFIQFSMTPVAEKLSAAVRTNSHKGYDFNPHLSLIYAQMPAATRSAEAQSLRVPFRRVCFDVIAVISFPRPIKTRADVEAWRMIASAKLTG